MSISATFYVQLLRQYSFAKKIKTQTVSREKLFETLLFEKASRKMLVILTIGLPHSSEYCKSLCKYRRVGFLFADIGRYANTIFDDCNGQ